MNWQDSTLFFNWSNTIKDFYFYQDQNTSKDQNISMT